MARARTKPKDEWANRSQPIEEDMRFQRWSWRVQIAGWVVLLLLALAAILGVFSNGWLSWTTAGSAAAGLEVRYQRVYRNEAVSWIDLRITAEAPGEQAVLVSAELVDHLDLHAIHPTPLRAETLPEGVRLLFGMGAAGTSQVRLTLHPQEAGSVEGSVSLGEGREPVPLSFFILP